MINLKTAILLISLVFMGCSQPKKTTEFINGKTEDSIPKISVTQQLAYLKEKGFETFTYIDEETGDTLIMKQYFIAFLNEGPNQSHTPDSLEILQNAHLNHLSKMYKDGFADISGPFADGGKMRGITIYNVPTITIADSLANADPMVQAGRLQIEIKPWWAAMGYPLR